jgi:hypothetical protein
VEGLPHGGLLSVLVADDADEIDLAGLSDEALVAQMHDDLYDGLADEIAEGTNLLLARGWRPTTP